MAFGQSSGPAAGHAQLKDLQSLLARAGYDDFRSARGPYQLNQKQGAGKFTRDEADELLARLREELGDDPEDDGPHAAAAAPPRTGRPAPTRAARPAKASPRSGRTPAGQEPAAGASSDPAASAPAGGAAVPEAVKPAAVKVPAEVKAASDDELVTELRRRGFRVFPPAR